MKKYAYICCLALILFAASAHAWNPYQYSKPFSAGSADPITYQGHQSADTESSANLTILIPAGTVQNDLLLAGIVDDADYNLILPAGWSLLADVSASTSRHSLAYKIATAAEPGSYIFTTGAAGASGIIARFSKAADRVWSPGVDFDTDFVIDGTAVSNSVTAADNSFIFSLWGSNDAIAYPGSLGQLNPIHANTFAGHAFAAFYKLYDSAQGVGLGVTTAAGDNALLSVISSAVTAAGTCVDAVVQDTGNSITDVYLWDNGVVHQDTKGQSFQLPSAGKLCSVSIKIGGVVGSSGPLYCRVGTTRDVSTTYWAADNNISTFVQGEWVTFTWANGPDLSAATPYYIMLRSEGNGWGDRLMLSSHSNGTTYPDGKVQQGDDWVALEADENNDDLTFKVGTK